jgi:hypothetical protein
MHGMPVCRSDSYRVHWIAVVSKASKAFAFYSRDDICDTEASLVVPEHFPCVRLDSVSLPAIARVWIVL